MGIFRDMHELLRTYIENYSSVSLSEEEYELLKKTFIPKKLKRKQFFLQEGDVCKYTGFIIKGAMRQYSIDDKGIEHIVHLAVENWWISDRESFMMSTPSIYNIDALEDTEMLVYTNADLHNLLNDAPSFSKMVTLLDQQNVFATQKRLHSSISYPAEKRYTDFMENHQGFFQRFPQHMIASYLGISPETLSRIRKNVLNKKLDTSS